MRFEVNIDKRYFFGLLGVILVLAGVVFAVAQGNNLPNPGHSASDISGRFSQVEVNDFVQIFTSNTPRVVASNGNPLFVGGVGGVGDHANRNTLVVGRDFFTGNEQLVYFKGNGDVDIAKGDLKLGAGGVIFPDGTRQTSAGGLDCQTAKATSSNGDARATCPSGYDKIISGGGSCFLPGAGEAFMVNNCKAVSSGLCNENGDRWRVACKRTDGAVVGQAEAYITCCK